jgi:hypothetical protein
MNILTGVMKKTEMVAYLKKEITVYPFWKNVCFLVKGNEFFFVYHT